MQHTTCEYLSAIPPRLNKLTAKNRRCHLTNNQRFGYLFIMLTYIFMLAWLGVTAFTSLPVFMYFNIWTICQNTTIVEGANLCLDLRQFGIVTIGEEKKICTGSENFYKMCESNELDLTFHLFIVALAGAGAAVIAMTRCKVDLTGFPSPPTSVHLAFFLQIPWMTPAEPHRSVFRTQAVAPTAQPFPPFPHFMEEIHSSWDRPVSAPSILMQAIPPASLDGAEKLGLTGFPPG
ncbi:UNVERIFIED_CONTAM: hypothetical protein FKN15_042304 [Acipenser sinensis]